MEGLWLNVPSPRWCCVVSAGIVLEAAKITVQKDPKIDVATFKTWVWHPTAPGDVKVWISADSKSEPVKKQYEPVLMQAVEEQIAARGYTPASAPPADFVITYRLLIAMKDSSQYMGQFLPTNANWGIPPFSPQTQSFSYYPQGTLIIDAEMPNSGPNHLARDCRGEDRTGEQRRKAGDPAARRDQGIDWEIPEKGREKGVIGPSGQSH